MERTPKGNEVLDFDPRNLPQEHLAAIGLMSAAASHTDSIVEMAIAGMLGIDGEQGWAVTAHMSAPLRTSVLKSAAEIVIDDGNALDVLDDIMNDIKTAAEARNDMIHGSWAFRQSDKAVLLIQQSARTHVEATLIPVTVNEIKRKALTLYEAGLSLMEFIIEAKKVPPLPRERNRGDNAPKARKARRKNNGK
ncbi:MAG TPA: hypothetical protein VLM18_05395 [Croceibacterium sp.]|nr:hypothetical protein [Croceibacterium sp.]